MVSFSPSELEALALLANAPSEEPLVTAVKKLLSETPAEPDGEVDFQAKVPEKLFNEFKGFFPQYGATKWFINGALTTLLERVRGNPELVFLVPRAVDDMLATTRSRRD